ncbi:MAG TPA: DUF4395 family protein [Thermoanaerobaculia bacterium]|nr:DUF4395 family protein [Thermoanaerobaculia bacterium]
MSDSQLVDVGRWMRFTPCCNLALTVVGTATGSVWLLAGLALFMAVGALAPAHPFDVLYNTLVRRATGTSSVPRSGARRKVVFVVGTIWLAATAVLFASGHRSAGFVLGFLMALFILPLATVNLCVLSETLARLFGPPKPAS